MITFFDDEERVLFVEGDDWRVYNLADEKSREWLSEKLISMVKLGVSMGIVTDIDAQKVNEINIISKPATLQKYAKETLTGKDLDIKRAEFIQKIIKK